MGLPYLARSPPLPPLRSSPLLSPHGRIACLRHCVSGVRCSFVHALLKLGPLPPSLTSQIRTDRQRQSVSERTAPPACHGKRTDLGRSTYNLQSVAASPAVTFVRFITEISQRDGEKEKHYSWIHFERSEMTGANAVGALVASRRLPPSLASLITQTYDDDGLRLRSNHRLPGNRSGRGQQAGCSSGSGGGGGAELSPSLLLHSDGGQTDDADAVFGSLTTRARFHCHFPLLRTKGARRRAPRVGDFHSHPSL